jgi:ABC-type glycerol-3-phosphate transport system substrate-binding protein
MKRYALLFFLILLLNACQSAPAEPETVTLDLAVLYDNKELARFVSAYNTAHEDIQINIVNYNEEKIGFDEALNKLKIEIIGGRGPDLVNLGTNYSPLDAASIFTNLYPIMENDPSFHKEDYYFNIMDSFAVGESLYVIVPKYSIDTFSTVNPALRGLGRYDMQKLAEVYESRPAGTILFPGETKLTVFAALCYGSMANYIDWDKGTCRFDSESFVAMLDFANQFPLQLVMANDYSPKEDFALHRAILFPAGIVDVFAVTQARILFGETPAFIGNPCDSGNGNVVQIGSIAIGISPNSLHKEEAWAFIKSFLDSEYQDNIKAALPIRVQSLEQALAEAMTVEYDENGEMVVKSQLRFEGEVADDIYQITEEDAEALRTIIRNIEANCALDDPLYSILMEEADYFFNNNKSAADVAAIIQSRAQVYISERK